MTLKEFSKETGIAYRTVVAYAQKAGKSKTTGAGFHTRADGSTLHNVTQGTETAMSAHFCLAMLIQKES